MPEFKVQVPPVGQPAAIKQPAVLNYLQRLFLICDLTHLPADSFSSFKTPVETFTAPGSILQAHTAHIHAENSICAAALFHYS